MTPSAPHPSTDTKLTWNYPLRVGLLIGVLLLGALSTALPRASIEIPRNPITWAFLIALIVVAAYWMFATRILTVGAQDQPGEWVTGKTWHFWGILGVLLIPLVGFGQWATPTSGDNIVRLELAGSQAVAAHLDYPNEEVIHAALRGDYGFIAAYVLALFLLVRWSGCYYRLEPIRRIRVPLSFAVVGAGVLDVIEDLCLRFGDRSSVSSRGSLQDLLWELAATCAWAKFAILVTALGFIIGGVWSWYFTPAWVRAASWQLREPVWDSPDRPDLLNLRYRRAPYGIALSGGGIRAASISLGAMQVLENNDDGQPALGWDQASVVTAVSGGSNMASGWSLSRSEYDTSVYGRQERDKPEDIEPAPWSLGNTMTAEEEHLFANLGYLLASSPRANTGHSDTLVTNAEQVAESTGAARAQRFRPTAVATVLAGFAVNIAVFVIILWVLVTPLGWLFAGLNDGALRGDDFRDLVSDYHLAIPGIVLAVASACFLFLWVLCAQIPALSRDLARNARKQALFRSLQVLGYGSLGLAVALTLVLDGLPLLAGWLETGGLKSLVTAGASAGGVLGAAARILRKPGARFAPYLGGVAFLIFAVIVAVNWTAHVAGEELSWAVNLDTSISTMELWLLGILALILGPLLISPELWSLAGFYRGKLRMAYATYRRKGAIRVYQNDGNTSDTQRREPWLHSFRRKANPEQVSTPLTVCTTATVSSRSVRTHYAIPALSVTFDPRYVTVHVPISDHGAWSEHSAPTWMINNLAGVDHKRLTTMMAVAISSAAVSPAMGRVSIGPTRMLLTFANIRLGVWMPNPRYVNAHPVVAEQARLGAGIPQGEAVIGYPRTGLGYLFKEFLGIHDLSDPYLYLTDGGHWENTGLVEILRRPDIHEIVCVDADCGSLEGTSSLAKVLDLAPLECGVRIQINLDPLRADDEGPGPAYAERTVTVGFFRRGPSWKQDVGIIWYSKPGLSRDMSAALLGFSEGHPDFPVTSTTDQFFDSSTYLAYRELGRHNARRIRKARRQLASYFVELNLPTAAPNDADRARLLAAVESARNDKRWVVQELARTARFMPESDRVDFLLAVRKVLLETNSSASQ